MCRPPDLGPAAAGFEDDTYNVYPGDGMEWHNDGNLDSGDLEGSEIDAVTFLGKRNAEAEACLADVVSRAAKLPRAAAPVSSTFDSAAASFMAKMEQSMLQDFQRQQQQRRLAAAVEGEESLMLQRALLEQQSKLQQLQQLQLLKQLQQNKQAQVQTGQSIPGFLAQQQLLQQAKLIDSLVANRSAAAAAQLSQSAAWASLPNPPAAPVAPVLAPRATVEAKIQAWMHSGLGAAPAPGIPVKSSLPALQPKPALPLSTAASLLCAAHNAPAAGLFNMGSLNDSTHVYGDDKKNKRMQSNRASAKRSRQRRQARLEELDKSTSQLQTENIVMCSKLEEAHQEIEVLEQKNRSLQGEVMQLRKMLGLEASARGKGKAIAEAALSAGHQQSCIDSEAGSFDAPVSGKALRVKIEAESAAPLVDTASGEEQDTLDWLDEIPLSPSSELLPKAESQLCNLMGLDEEASGLDQMLVQGDPFSELLACFDG